MLIILLCESLNTRNISSYYFLLFRSNLNMSNNFNFYFKKFFCFNYPLLFILIILNILNMLNNSPYPIRKINSIHPKDSTHVSFFEEMRRLKTPQAIGMSKYFNRKYYHSVDKTNHKTNLRIGDSPISKEYISKKLISMKSQSNLVNNDLNDFSYNSNQNNKSINTQLNPSYSFVNNFENSSSFLLSQNTNKIKEKLIQNLKNNFSQERLRRKKMLSVNLNVNINQNYSMINNNNNNNTTSNTIQPTSITQGNPFLDNSNNNHPNFVSTINKKEQPLKLYTDTNSLKPGFKTIQYLNRNSSTELNLNNRDNFFTSNNCNSGDIEPLERSNVFTSSTINKIFNEKIFDLEVKFDKMIKENVNNSKSRRYNITKLILDEFVKSISQTSSVLSNFLRKILYSYHTSFSMFANENKELKDKVEIYETSKVNKYIYHNQSNFNRESHSRTEGNSDG